MRGPRACALVLLAACGAGPAAPGDDDDVPGPDAPNQTSDAPVQIVDDDADGIDDATELQLAMDYLPFISLAPDDGCSRSGLVVRVRPHPQDATKIVIIYDHLFETDHPGAREVIERFVVDHDEDAQTFLAAYFATAAWSTWFLFAEFWAGGVAVMAVLALVQARWHVGAILIGVAVAFRELMVVLVPAFLVGWWLHRHARAPRTALAAALVLPAAALAAHFIAAPVAPGASGWDLSPWLNGSFAQLIETLRFSSNFVPVGPGVLAWAPVAALAGALQIRPRWRSGLLLGAVGFPSLALFTFSAGLYGLYWGAILQPLAIALAPVAAARLDPPAPDS